MKTVEKAIKITWFGCIQKVRKPFWTKKLEAKENLPEPSETTHCKIFFGTTFNNENMDRQTEQVYQIFLTLLENLNLPENIFGFTAALLLLAIIISIKTIVLSCVVQKLKHCAISPTQFSCDNLEIV